MRGGDRKGCIKRGAYNDIMVGQVLAFDNLIMYCVEYRTGLSGLSGVVMGHVYG